MEDAIRSVRYLLRACYAKSGTDVAYGAVGLRACCAQYRQSVRHDRESVQKILLDHGATLQVAVPPSLCSYAISGTGLAWYLSSTGHCGGGVGSCAGKICQMASEGTCFASTLPSCYALATQCPVLTGLSAMRMLRRYVGMGLM
eukprot:1240714-Rhodomonas_salina.1